METRWRAGNDIYVVESAGDTLVEFADEGVDRVLTQLASYSLENLPHIEEPFGTYASGQTLTGNAADNFIIGTDGNDTLYGLGGRDVMVGGAGNDSLIGGGDVGNELHGGTGNDTFYVFLHDTIVELAGQGTDAVVTPLPSYTLGAELENLVYTGSGNFTGNGNAKANWIEGGAGNDTLNGGLGSDFLVGNGASDFFVFDTTLGPGNIDTLIGFVPNADRILLDNAVFTGLAEGVLPASAFHVGTTAADADDRILYNPATGALFFDADGTGDIPALRFAAVTPNLAVTAADFVVI